MKRVYGHDELFPKIRKEEEEWYNDNYPLSPLWKHRERSEKLDEEIKRHKRFWGIKPNE